MRPEAGRLLLKDGAGPGDLRLEGEVEALEPDYTHRTLMVGLKSGEQIFWAAGSFDEWVRLGERIAVAFPAEALYFFDEQSGMRI